MFELLKDFLKKFYQSEDKKMIIKVFTEFFKKYKDERDKPHLEAVITSADREGDPNSNPHALSGNAIDFSLRIKGDYASIYEYNNLFAYMLENWEYRAGIDNTVGNIHIHIDLGRNRPGGQEMPYFFKEDDQKWLYEITSKDQI
jgi:hypothetical protein